MNAQIALLVAQEKSNRPVAREPLRLRPARPAADRRDGGPGLRALLVRFGGRTVEVPPVAP